MITVDKVVNEVTTDVNTTACAAAKLLPTTHGTPCSIKTTHSDISTVAVCISYTFQLTENTEIFDNFSK